MAAGEGDDHNAFQGQNVVHAPGHLRIGVRIAPPPRKASVSADHALMNSNPLPRKCAR